MLTTNQAVTSGKVHPSFSNRTRSALGAQERTGLAILLVVATVLRLRGLGEGLWYDEIVTLVRYVRPPVSEILGTFDTQNQHLLYSLLAHLSVASFGDSVWALRMPAAILGVASIGALVWFGRIVATKTEATVAAIFLTFSYHHVWFSQNARGYTGLLLAALISTGLMVKMTQPGVNQWRTAVAYGVTMAAAASLHISAAFIAVGHALTWLLYAIIARQSFRPPNFWAPLAGFALAGLLALALYAPVLNEMLETFGKASNAGAAIEWSNPQWLVRETLMGLARGLPGGLLSLAGALGVALAGIWSYARSDARSLLLMFLPVATTGAALLATRHNLWPRLFFFAAGFGVLIVIRGVFVISRRLGPRHARHTGIGASLILATASATTIPSAWNPKQDYLGALEFVERSRGPDDGVVVADMTAIPFTEYQKTDWEVVTSLAGLEKVEAQHSQTWLVVSFPPRLASSYPELWSYATEHYAPAGRFGGTVGGGDIIVLVRRR